ncbi:MAG: alpha,alpha-trehalose-phosphate synthase (UDP-forming) [Candidatus Levyibacteriota bacterium]
MKQLISAFLLIIFAVSMVILSFTIRQVDNEQNNLTSDLQHRSALLSDSFIDTIEPYVAYNNAPALQQIVDRYTNRERLMGLAVYDNKGNVLALSSGLATELAKTPTLPATIMDANKADGQFLPYNGQKLYLFATPLHSKQSVIGAIMLIQNADYIDADLISIWKTNLLRLFVQVLLISIASFIVLHWIIYRPILAMVQAIRDTRLGKISKNPVKQNLFFQPLITEFTRMSKSLQEARLSASQEAKMRNEQADSPWTAQRLQGFIEETLRGRKIFLVSNREPYIHFKQNGKISMMEPASGMVTALEPIMQACGGLWIAQASGNADKTTVDDEDKIKVPPDDPKYTLKRVWITEEEEKGYYYGFANEGLWPLCHTAHTRPVFRKEDWMQYQRVNGKFAQHVLKEIADVEKPIILIQDYHLALLPRMIKNSRPDALIGIFWHIPWPNSESFNICPWRKEILDGMLGADLLGFHTQLHCNNFMDTVGHDLEALIDLEQFSIQRNEHTSFVRPFPISIPFFEDGEESTQEEFANLRNEIQKKLNFSSKYIGVGVDRLDYTKGILERLRAIEYFLQTYPSFKQKFTFIQIAAPSRNTIPEYNEFGEEVEKETERINTIFKTKTWKPIILLKKHHTHQEIDSYYKIADICLVTSLHDGMNLVAKEYVMSRNDEKGVLILSQFAGASRSLKDALIINPYNIEQTAEAIHQGLTMLQSEQMKRMKKMRELIKNYNVYRWSAELLKSLLAIES